MLLVGIKRPAILVSIYRLLHGFLEIFLHRGKVDPYALIFLIPRQIQFAFSDFNVQGIGWI